MPFDSNSSAKTEYFAFNIDGSIRSLGHCRDFDEADGKTSTNHTHWIFDRESLEDFINKARQLLS